MNKDLNKEYSEMIRTDLPDLWDRISENLPEKQKKPEKTKIYRFAAVAAACICVAILIPVIALNSRTAHFSGKAEVAMATADAAEQKTAAGAEETVNPAEAAPAEAYEEPAAEESYKEAAAAEAAYDEAAPAAPSDTQNAEGGTTRIYNVTVNITAIREKEEDRQLLEAHVVTGGDNLELEIGEEILLVIDSLTPVELIEELSTGITEFDLERSEEEGEVLYFIR